MISHIRMSPFVIYLSLPAAGTQPIEDVSVIHASQHFSQLV